MNQPATYHATPDEMKALMVSIIEHHYPHLFTECQAIANIAESTDEIDIADDAKQLVDSIYVNTERLYYKEKLILFPYLEKNIKLNDPLEKYVAAINVSVEETSRIAKMVESFKPLILEDPMVINSDIRIRLSRAFKSLENAWWTVCVNKQRLYQNFTAFHQN